MKVTKGKEEFKPITITIETKEEADALYHTLYCAFSESLEDHCKREGVDTSAIRQMTINLFHALDNIYEP